MSARASSKRLREFEPKTIAVFRAGYGLADLRADAIAGLTVAIIALPLAMALAIASGAAPEKGLHTAIIAGFLISFLGGSKVQIGGPTAAFIPVVFAIIEKFGYGGLILCTLMAGLMLIAAGLLRLGTLMKYIPQPVVTGFTAGIAVSIFSSQIKDALGLRMGQVPAEFLPRWAAYAKHIATTQPAAVALTLLGLFTILALHGTVVVSAGEDGFARLWRRDDLTPIAALPHAQPLRAVTVRDDADGTTLVCGDMLGRTHRWRSADGFDWHRLELRHRHRAAIRALRWLPNGRLGSAGEDGRVLIDDFHGDGWRDAARHANFATDLLGFADGRLLSAGYDGRLRIARWNTASLDASATVPPAGD